MSAGPASGAALDILADLAPAHECPVAEMRRTHPELAAQWDRVMAVPNLPNGKPVHASPAVASWFVERGIGRLTKDHVQRHRRNECGTCRTTS